MDDIWRNNSVIESEYWQEIQLESLVHVSSTEVEVSGSEHEELNIYPKQMAFEDLYSNEIYGQK